MMKISRVYLKVLGHTEGKNNLCEKIVKDVSLQVTIRC